MSACGCGAKNIDPSAFSLACRTCSNIASSKYTSAQSCEADAEKMNERGLKCRGCKSVSWGAVPNASLCQEPAVADSVAPASTAPSIEAVSEAAARPAATVAAPASTSFAPVRSAMDW
eukprot:Amastigsp_a324_176.p2 type:complete len:118 gc:universal Amastigsp_a324_176:72-425(+)